MATYNAKKGEIERSWYVVDAEGKVLGKLATRVADVLRGKHKPIFTPYVDTGDFVVVINAEKVHLTGTKIDNKKYYRHSGYPGGIKVTTPAELLRKKPEIIIEHAVKGMLPKNKLGREQFKKLKVYILIYGSMTSGTSGMASYFNYNSPRMVFLGKGLIGGLYLP